MNIEFEKPNLECYLTTDYDNYMMNDIPINDESEVIVKVGQYLENIKEIQPIINSDMKKLNDFEFINLLKKICDIELDEYDFLKIFSMAHNKKFSKYEIINTSMTRQITKTEGYGHSFDYYDTIVGTQYKVAVAEDANISLEHRYSVKEITKLIETEKIIIVEKKDMEIYEEFPSEEYQSLPITDIQKITINNLLSSKNPFYSLILKYIRKKVTTKKIRNGFNNYLIQLNEEINDLCCEKEMLEAYRNTLKRKGYTKALKRLTNLNKK